MTLPKQILGTIFRFSFISFIYGFLLLILPWLGAISKRNIRTRFRLLILLTGLISLLAITSQIIFQSILLANKPYGHTLDNCTKTTEILRYFGLERLDNSNAIRVLRLIFPDIVIFAISTICFFVIRRTLIVLRRRQSEIQSSITSNAINLSPSIDSSTSTTHKRISWPRLLSIVRRIRLFIQFIIVGFAAFVYPSIINSIYFIFFLIIAFVWSLSIKFGKKFAFVRASLVIYTGMHLLTLYLYQFTFFQEALPPLSLWSNITGLTAIVTNNCTSSEPYVATNLTWNDYVNPCAILLLYFYFAFETNRAFFQRKVRSNTTTIQSLEQQSLVVTVERPDILEQNSRSLQRRWSFEQSGDQTWQGRIIFVILSLLRVLERQSYLLSLIAMLAWSITYHSLLTLIFLLWACLLWVLPNSRKWCLRMSPFFTIYGGILLILQYITGFTISFDQFKFGYDRRTMEQIGIQTNDYYPAFVPLLVKSLYMMIFCLTFRQYINERRSLNIPSTEGHRVSISANSYAGRLGRWFISFLTKYWIFVSCGMILLVSIRGTVVIYRIIYMIFYLFFILSFQFELVNEFLSAKLSKELLASIGLEVVPSEVLAVRLLTPSAFLIVNIMQLYYFHSEWMKLITMPSSYYWEHIVTELRSQAKLASQGAALFNEMSYKRIEEDRVREEETVSKITRSLKRIQEQQLKLNESDSKSAGVLMETSEHFEAIRSGDYYMFEYESEEPKDEGKEDEATVAQEQIFQVLAANDKDETVADIGQSKFLFFEKVDIRLSLKHLYLFIFLTEPRTSSTVESDVQEQTTASQTAPLPATTIEVMPLSPTLEQATSVESKEEKSKTKQNIIFIKIRLIVWIIVDYLINLFNKNSRDYREVSNKLAEMKSKDKVFQHERMRMETRTDQNSVINVDQMAGGDHPNPNIQVRSVSQSSDLSERSRFYRLCESLFYFAMSRSELLCYSTMILNHLTSGTLLSMPLPLSIFLWATLSHRSSRNYWITVLTYTEAMIVVKYIFQFRFYPWYADAADVRPLSAINIIGINRKENAASVTDLLLLLSLFLHRSILKV
ncbi:unnamed protein product [Rotaria sp. Silwood2]|nr:unnamed protein product [Rotaria sp. Silwood2]